jgi:hypothetical protein
MKFLTYADRSVLIGNEAADTLIEYSAVLAEHGHADSVALNAIGADGDDIVASFVLGSGTNLMAESTSSKLPEPNNADGISYMKERLVDMSSTHPVQPDAEAIGDTKAFDTFPGEIYQPGA